MPAFVGTTIGGKFGLMRLALALFQVGEHARPVNETELSSDHRPGGESAESVGVMSRAERRYGAPDFLAHQTRFQGCCDAGHPFAGGAVVVGEHLLQPDEVRRGGSTRSVRPSGVCRPPLTESGPQ